MTTLTLAALNKVNRGFWDNELELAQGRMTDQAVLATALAALNSELRMSVPVRNQKSLYVALIEAEEAKRRFATQLGHAGGGVAKRDTLQKLIESIVATRPNITRSQLLDHLLDHQSIEPIQDVSERKIFFSTAKNTTKSAPISGLKDRLSRAKRKVKSR